MIRFHSIKLSQQRFLFKRSEGQTWENRQRAKKYGPILGLGGMGLTLAFGYWTHQKQLAYRDETHFSRRYPGSKFFSQSLKIIIVVTIMTPKILRIQYQISN